jgi:hypothetical protein
MPLLARPQCRDLFLEVLESAAALPFRGRRETALHASQSAETGLVPQPQQWPWSGYRHYADGERGLVLVNEERKAELKVRKVA